MFGTTFFDSSTVTKSVASLVLYGLMMLTVACAPSPEEKAKDAADQTIAALQSNAQALDAMGAPDEIWSEESLTRYENLLDALQADSAKLRKMDGKDGIIIFGTWSLDRLETVVSHNRNILHTARSKRAKKLLVEEHDHLVAIQLVAIDKMERDFAGDSAAWSKTEVLERIELLNQIEERQRAIESLKTQIGVWGSRAKPEFWKAMSDIRRDLEMRLKQLS